MQKVLITVLVLFFITGCAHDNSAKIEELRNDVNILKSKVEAQEGLIEDIEEQKLLNQTFMSEVYRLDALNNMSLSDNSLINLTPEELNAYENYKVIYDETNLKNLSPISVCKIYLYAWVNRDADTVYELYTKNEDYVLWSKEEQPPMHTSSPDDSVFDQYRGVFDIDVGYGYDGSGVEYACISWYSENATFLEYSADGVPFRFGFSMIKDGEVWKVEYMPMQ